MRAVWFDPATWGDVECRLGSDRKSARRSTGRIAEIQCDPFTGIGKPEPLAR